MRDFVYHAPTEVVFGKQSEEKVALLRDGGVDFVCLGGVVPNPRLSLVHEGIDLCRQEGVDFILAVGGGSVIDSAKAIACGVPYDGEVWDFYTGKASPACYLPVACVLTIPAAGSEMSESSVITNEDGDVKGRRREAGLFQPAEPAQVRHHEPGPHLHPAPVPDCGRRHGHDHAHDGALFLPR